jgi:predicted SnoaL-like aldol condensation-catalyzing enzyme
MSTEQNKALVRQLVEEVLNRGNMSRADEIIAPNFVEHEELPPQIPPGREAPKLMFTMLRSAFPDFKATIKQLIAEGDKVVLYMTSIVYDLDRHPEGRVHGRSANWKEHIH